MTEYWKQLSARINAFSLRERILLFACVVVVLGVLTDLLFVSPLTEQQKLLARQIDQKSAESEAQRDKLLAVLRQRDSERALVLDAEMRRVQGELDLIEKEIASLRAAGDAAAMPSMLARVLRRTDRVTLVRVVAASTEGAMPVTTAPVAAVTSLVAPTRGGLDITLSGGYLDLMDYLASLEKALPNARWGAIHFSTESSPAQVTVRIVTQTGGV